MVETRTLNQDQIEAMMARVNSVPMMHTLDLEILRLDHGECDAKDQKADTGAKKRKLDGAAVGDGKRQKK